jgi:Holliday junction resolvase RusA-like endonuclease
MSMTFQVYGTPAPQGSKVAFRVGQHVRMKEASGAKHAIWRDAVAVAAHNAFPGEPPLLGPLRLTVRFRFPMPKSRTKAQREKGYIYKTSAPDIDKLVRCVGDALMAAGVVKDDSQFVSLSAFKHETTAWTGAEITLEELS